jgi:hypothetical protein
VCQDLGGRVRWYSSLPSVGKPLMVVVTVQGAPLIMRSCLIAISMTHMLDVFIFTLMYPFFTFTCLARFLGLQRCGVHLNKFVVVVPFHPCRVPERASSKFHPSQLLFPRRQPPARFCRSRPHLVHAPPATFSLVHYKSWYGNSKFGGRVTVQIRT